MINKLIFKFKLINYNLYNLIYIKYKINYESDSIIIGQYENLKINKIKTQIFFI